MRATRAAPPRAGSAGRAWERDDGSCAPVSVRPGSTSRSVRGVPSREGPNDGSGGSRGRRHRASRLRRRHHGTGHGVGRRSHPPVGRRPRTGTAAGRPRFRLPGMIPVESRDCPWQSSRAAALNRMGRWSRCGRGPGVRSVSRTRGSLCPRSRPSRPCRPSRPSRPCRMRMRATLWPESSLIGPCEALRCALRSLAGRDMHVRRAHPA